MAKKYAEPVGWILLNGLHSRSLLQLLWGTTKFHGPSRLAVYLDVLTYPRKAQRPRKVRPALETLADALNADDILSAKKWLAWLLKKKWFAQDTEGFIRPLYKGRQALRAALQADVAVRWVISDLTEKSVEVNGKIQSVYRDKGSPHGNRGFMEEVGRSEPTVIACLERVVADGFTIRFPRVGKGRKTLYVRPDNEDVISDLQEQYGLPAEPSPIPAMVESMAKEKVIESGSESIRPRVKPRGNDTLKIVTKH
jgi:hypothetical protein